MTAYNTEIVVTVRNAWRDTAEGKANRSPIGVKLRVEWDKACVKEDGTVMVWDYVSKFWRRDHYLTAAQIRTVRAKCRA